MHSSPRRPRPGRRRPMERLPVTVSLLTVILTVLSCASAYEMPVAPQAVDSAHFKELAARGEIYIDTRPQPRNWLERRQDTLDETIGESTSSSSEAVEPTSSSTASTSSTSTSESSPTAETDTPTSTSSDSSPSITVITTPLPSPFDTSIGSNFTGSSCPSFFTTFLSNSTFRSCTPISLLLQTSSSFFRAMSSPSLLTATLDTACAAPLSICYPLMTDFAQQLIQDENCGQDFRNQQPLVLQAYNGLIAYEPVYRATCLKQTDDNQYCFSEAVSTSPNPADVYPYRTAVGMSMPSGSRPTCNGCLKQTMQVFAEYAVRKEQPLAQTYLSSANIIYESCGDGYADLGVNVGSVDSGLENGHQGGQGTNGAGKAGGSVMVMVVAAFAAVMALL